MYLLKVTQFLSVQNLFFIVNIKIKIIWTVWLFVYVFVYEHISASNENSRWALVVLQILRAALKQDNFIYLITIITLIEFLITF